MCAPLLDRHLLARGRLCPRRRPRLRGRPSPKRRQLQPQLKPLFCMYVRLYVLQYVYIYIYIYVCTSIYIRFVFYLFILYVIIVLCGIWCRLQQVGRSAWDDSSSLSFFFRLWGRRTVIFQLPASYCNGYIRIPD